MNYALEIIRENMTQAAQQCSLTAHSINSYCMTLNNYASNYLFYSPLLIIALMLYNFEAHAGFLVDNLDIFKDKSEKNKAWLKKSARTSAYILIIWYLFMIWIFPEWHLFNYMN